MGRRNENKSTLNTHNGRRNRNKSAFYRTRQEEMEMYIHTMGEKMKIRVHFIQQGKKKW